MRTNDLVVLDYPTNTVHIHKIADHIENVEAAVEALGYDLNDVHYMCGDIEVITHTEVLTNAY